MQYGNTHINSVLVIRPFIQEDLTALYDIEKYSEHARWSRKNIDDEVSSASSAFVLSALVPASSIWPNSCLVAGYISFSILWEELYIRKIAVHPQYRRLGIASMLLSHAETAGVEAGATRAVLEVTAANSAAVKLYEKNGFDFAERGDRPGSSPLVMVKSI